jgi:hypothetical protein
MIKKTSKQNSKEKKFKNDTRIKKKQVLKKTKSSNVNSKKISTKPTPKKTSKLNSSMKSNKEIVLKRSSGRAEKFDTNKLTLTVSRSGVSFPVARDVAKSITKKIKKSVQEKATGTTKKKQKSSVLATKQQKLKLNTKKEEPEKVIVTANQIKNLVDDELKERNQQDHSPSFLGNTTTPSKESSMKITLNDREPVIDKVAANKNKVLFDPSRQ